MKPQDVRDHFGTWRKAMEELCLSKNTFLYWGRKKKIPYATQKRIEKMTKGKLKADERMEEAIS